MKISRISAIVSVVLSLCSASMLFAKQAPEKISAVDLKANYETAPLGIDIVPQFSWKIESNRNNCLQSAYQVLVSTDPALLEKGEADIWDSGKVESSSSVGVVPAMTLESRRTYFWKVRVWNQNGLVSDWSEPTHFEAGLLNKEDWQGGWIGYVPGMPGRVLYFKSNVWVPEGKKILRARAYIAGIGTSELLINHKKVGDHVLDPAQSTYSKRIYYVTHDIAEYLQPGANTLVVPVAPGWLGTARLKAKVEILYDDLTWDVRNSDGFRNVITGPTVYSTVFDGEKYDAREDKDCIWNYSHFGLMNKQWAWAHNTDDPTGVLMSQRVEPIKVMEEITPKFVCEPAPGVYVFDAGRNLAGWVAMKAHGAAGDEMTIKFAETCYQNGFINQENLRNAKVTDTYVFRGDAEECWEPSFTYHGFRYFQVEGLKYKPAATDFTVKMVRSSLASVGSFKSSNPLLNDINTMIVNTEANNLHSVPTDCPQRDERMGWLNDMTVRIETAMYNYDFSRFYPKFIEDVTDTQDEEGRITCVAPFRFGMRPADPVSASYLIMAEKCYEFYGDTRIIRRNFDGMKAWTDYLRSRTDDGIVNYSYYGDWCPPKKFSQGGNSTFSADTPGIMMSTGYLYFCEKTIAKMAEIIGKPEIAAQYYAYAEETAKAFNAKWYNEEAGGYTAVDALSKQGANSFALWLGIVAPEKVEMVAKTIADDVRKNDYHLTTGNLCTKYLLEALTENGYVYEAYRIASQTTYPSWGYMLESGATALWERWENLTGDEMNSHNHPMMGSAGSWFKKYLVGIRPEWENPGFAHFTIKPYIPTGLASVEGTLDTVKGEIACSWSVKGKALTMKVTIPAGSTATVGIPSRKGYTYKEVGSGSYTFTSKL